MKQVQLSPQWMSHSITDRTKSFSSFTHRSDELRVKSLQESSEAQKLTNKSHFDPLEDVWSPADHLTWSRRLHGLLLVPGVFIPSPRFGLLFRTRSPGLLWDSAEVTSLSLLTPGFILDHSGQLWVQVWTTTITGPGGTPAVSWTSWRPVRRVLVVHVWSNQSADILNPGVNGAVIWTGSVLGPALKNKV